MATNRVRSKTKATLTEEKGALAAVAEPNFYDKYELNNAQIEDLEGCAGEIVRLTGDIQRKIIDVGNQLLKARAILGDRTTFKKQPGVKATRGVFIAWAEERVCKPMNVSIDTIQRWAAIAEEVNTHPERAEAVSSTPLTVLYEAIKPSFPEDLKAAVFNAEKPVLTQEQILDIKKLYQAACAQEKDITPAAIVTLSEAEYTVSNTTLKHLSLVAPEEQTKFAQELVNDRHKGLQSVREYLREQKVEGLPELNKIETKFAELPPESIDLAIIECPLGAAWKDSEIGLKQLADRLEDVLVPGGFAIIFMGHTTILSAASYLTNLVPLQLLTCRKQPGNSSTNVGVNLGYAAVHAMLCYKGPFRAPSHIVFDLQTFEQTETPPDALGEVVTGIEQGICKFMDSLVEPGFNVAHLVLGNRSYNLRTTLSEKLEDLNAGKFFLL